MNTDSILRKMLSAKVAYWLAAGGVFYITGSFFYALAKHEFVHSVF